MTIYAFITMALAFAGLLIWTLSEREDAKRLDWLEKQRENRLDWLEK